jgi:hypothetical protein
VNGELALKVGSGLPQCSQTLGCGMCRISTEILHCRIAATHCQFGDIVTGAFTPVLAKHTKSFNLIDTLAVGVDRIQRSFEPMRHQVEEWRQAQITDERAKLILYSAFVDGKLEAPRSLLSEVHRLYFQPQYEEFSPRTMWSLSNAFTSAFKELDPVPQFKATAKLGEFLAQLLA